MDNPHNDRRFTIIKNGQINQIDYMPWTFCRMPACQHRRMAGAHFCLTHLPPMEDDDAGT